jgi:site-specific recombinase XerD
MSSSSRNLIDSRAGQRDFLIAQKTGRPFRRLMIERRTHRWGRLAGVADVTPHRFRHTFATDLLDRKVDIRLVQLLLDHEDIRSTTIYTRVRDEQAFGAMMTLSSRRADPGGKTAADAWAAATGLQSGVLHPEISGESGDR